LQPTERPDRTQIEQNIAMTVGLKQKTSEKRQKADALFQQAIEAESDSDAMELLLAAVRTDPGHMDAWAEVSEIVDDDEQAIDILSRALKFGERELAEDLEHNRGYFWGLMHTRPYMRVRYKLAERYYEKGDFEAAASELEDLLELNPNDNQGVRWLLMEIYCRLDDLASARSLLIQYPDDVTPFLPFTEILIQFREDGDTPQLRQLLAKHCARNPHIAPRLLDHNAVSATEHHSFEIGSPAEADLYCRQFLFVWKSTPGAIAWLRKVSRNLQLTLPDDQTDRIDIKKEIQKIRKQVKKLPASNAVWIADIITLESRDGCMLVIIDQSTEAPVFLEPIDFPPDPDTILYCLFQAMVAPTHEDPVRPSRIVFTEVRWYTAFHLRLARLDITSGDIKEKPAALQAVARGVAAMSTDDDMDFSEIIGLPTASIPWIVDWRQLPIWIPDESGEMVQPWITTVLMTDSFYSLGQKMSTEPPDSRLLQSVICQAAMNEALGHASRPQQILVSSADHKMSLSALAEELQAELIIGDCSGADEYFEGLTEHLSGMQSGPPSLMAIPDVTPDMTGDFYEAAAEFYTSRLWLSTPPDTVVEVDCSQLIDGRRYAVVMGQMGQELGILFFENMDSLQALMNSSPGNEASGAAGIKGLAFSMDERPSISSEDAAAAEQFGWPVAAPEAWPTAYSVSDSSLSGLTADELRFLAAAIRSVTKQLQSKNDSLNQTVQLFDQEVTVSTRRLQ
jgi:tetratricopeptide (TPR) repeat protein